ncbi:MAG TPA: response regulator [Methylomirabilota bacterium]|nr:response regulator [Methylomirabilota bacterium]
MTASVLIVDDDHAILSVLEMRLEAMGCGVTAVRDPRDALGYLKERTFDLALVDLMMPEMDGMELMEAAHQIQPRLPVLIMTAHGTIDNAVAAMKRGAFDYLSKPFRTEELTTRVNRALAERRLTRDMERFRAMGRLLASTGAPETILRAIIEAALEATDAQGAALLLAENGVLRPTAHRGPWSEPPAAFTQVAEETMSALSPLARASDLNGVLVGAPLLVDERPVGALVIGLPQHYRVTDEDLSVLALFAAQAAVSVKTANDLSRLRSGALTALGRMATQVAHEIKNPLGGLKLYALHLERRLQRQGDPEGRELAQKIANAVDHLSDTVTDITAYGRPVRLSREPVPFNRFLDDCLALVQDRIDAKQARVVRQYDSSLPDAMVDPRELKKALLNFLVNALDAIQPHGELHVGTQRHEGAVEVTVRDNGEGMTPEVLARIFEPFFTTKEKGTGLGMSIAKGVVELHGGQLTLESTPGKGTTVRVTLPLETAR